MKHTLRFFLTISLFFSVIYSFAEKNSEDLFVCPTATISYPGGIFCTSSNPQQVILTGTETYLGGTFMSNFGLVINSVTGEIIPSSSAPGTYSITYTLPVTSGCPNIIATTTVTIIPNNTISSASSTPSVCLNTAIPVITHSTSGATGIGTATGLPVGVAASWSGNTITISGTPTSAGIFNYSIPILGGCGTDYATGTITVNALPTNITISGTTTICAGNSTNLTITGTPGTTINWTGTPSSFVIGSSGSTTMSINPTITTSFSLLSANLNGCSIPIVGQSATVVVAVTPQFVNQIPDMVVCNGDMLDLASQLTSTSAGTTYIWNATTINVNTPVLNGDETNINLIANLIDASQNGTISITIVPKLGNCFGASQQVLVTVKPVPAITSTTASQTSICNNQFIIITTNSFPLATSYNWQINSASGVQIVGGVTSGTSATGIINLQLALINSSIAGNISFNITSTNGICTGPTTTSNPITVNPIPGTPIGLPIIEICSGGTPNLNITSSPNMTGTMLEWTVIDSYNVTGFTNGIGMSPIYINDVLYNTTNTQGFVKYSVTSKLGNCNGGTTIYTVYVNPLPNPVLTDGNICVDATSGETYQGYVLDTQLSNPNFTYDWYILNTTTNIYDQIAGADASTFEASVAGNYQVLVTDMNSYCIATTSANVLATFPATGLTTTITDNSTITVTVNQAGTGNLIYTLDNGTSQESNVFTNVEPGAHTILVTDLEGCTNLTAEVMIDAVDTDLVTYPNPAFGAINFKNKNKVKTVQISNQIGQIVLTKEINLKNGTIDLSELNNGIYTIQFETESETINQRIIKQ